MRLEDTHYIRSDNRFRTYNGNPYKMPVPSFQDYKR